MTQTKTEEGRVCYLSVYRLIERYGGPEEGGWWYNDHELVAAVPFIGNVTYAGHTLEEDDHEIRPLIDGGFISSWLSDDAEIMYWYPRGVKASETRTAEWLAVEEDRLRQVFDINDESRGPEHVLVEEAIMGMRALFGRPRWR